MRSLERHLLIVSVLRIGQCHVGKERPPPSFTSSSGACCLTSSGSSHPRSVRASPEWRADATQCSQPWRAGPTARVAANGGGPYAADSARPKPDTAPQRTPRARQSTRASQPNKRDTEPAPSKIGPRSRRRTGAGGVRRSGHPLDPIGNWPSYDSTLDCYHSEFLTARLSRCKRRQTCRAVCVRLAVIGRGPRVCEHRRLSCVASRCTVAGNRLVAGVGEVATACCGRRSCVRCVAAAWHMASVAAM